jgi:hypothetical protein
MTANPSAGRAAVPVMPDACAFAADGLGRIFRAFLRFLESSTSIHATAATAIKMNPRNKAIAIPSSTIAPSLAGSGVAPAEHLHQ